jgi:uncharacterized membrane protein
MKIAKKVSKKCKNIALIVSSLTLSSAAFAEDKLANVLTGDLKDMLGSSGTFWKAFILVDIIFASAAAVKTKNPMTFLGVFVIALVPGFLIKTFVFGN